LEELAPQINSIVQGDVEDISFDNQECEGPRTIVHLNNVTTLAGSSVPSSMVLRTFGGLASDGTYVRTSESPRYVLGARYVLFLRNTDWRFSPVIGDLAFRREVIASKEVLVNTDGHAVTGVTENGIVVASPQLTEPVGLITKSMRPPDNAFAPPPKERGTVTQYGSNTADTQRYIPEPPDQDRAAWEQAMKESGEFSRPAIVAGVSEESVATAVTAPQLVQQMIDRSAVLGVKFGGYLALAPRIGCWDTTITSPVRK
jgi:hypothetical protein